MCGTFRDFAMSTYCFSFLVLYKLRSPWMTENCMGCMNLPFHSTCAGLFLSTNLFTCFIAGTGLEEWAHWYVRKGTAVQRHRWGQLPGSSRSPEWHQIQQLCWRWPAVGAVGGSRWNPSYWAYAGRGRHDDASIFWSQQTDTPSMTRGSSRPSLPGNWWSLMGPRKGSWDGWDDRDLDETDGAIQRRWGEESGWLWRTKATGGEKKVATPWPRAYDNFETQCKWTRKRPGTRWYLLWRCRQCGEYGWVLWASWPRREPPNEDHWPVATDRSRFTGQPS